MFSLFKKDASQPRKDWPWALTMGPILGVRKNPGWSNIENGLKALIQDGDSFLILEQKDPANPKRYWFIQSAIALQGPHQGEYTLEIGYKGENGAGRLLDRTFPHLEDLFPWYEAAFAAKKLDLSGFDDMSDMVQ